MIVVVSGLPRSGTSMMMKMLEAGGIPILTDMIREADEDNIKGYYEDERVKKLHKDNRWVFEANEKALKVISYQLRHLPPDYKYYIIFMERKIKEILLSQNKMMERRGETQDEVPDLIMGQLFQKHLIETKEWLNKQTNIKTIYISYNKILNNPKKSSEKIAQFLEKDFDIDKMIQVVDPDLYRQKK
jgi:hypothetical protein